MIRTIIFDFDGVLAESVDIKTVAFGKLFEAEGAEVARKVVEYHIAHTGVSRYDKFRYFYREFLGRELDDDTFRGLCRRFSELVVDEVVKAPYVEGAKEFLEEHAARYRFYVASATPQEEIEEIVARRGMTKFFSRTYGAPTGKAAAVKDILGRDPVLPEEALFVGDALSDMNAAAASGIHFVARIYEGNEDIFRGLGCARIRAISELKDAINVLEGQG
ncbi:MAG: HAD hydrolase-like protein [Candidatus Omnitrophica bacterium]|nr:HAD hydrolase-like protein [Candidatus Omnitrophota bacterium]MDD5489006.1 HAD hydrolase-like protein [Candidatus Omnitrophota bacterium]